MRDDMLNLLESGTESLQRLIDLMTQEAELLRQRQSEGLQPLLEGKVEALQALERVELQRRELVGGAGFSATEPEGMHAYLEAQDDETLSAAWHAFLELLAEVQARNEGNGRIVNRSLSQVERELAILSGQSSSGADTYDPQGRRSGSRGRNITRA